MNRLTLLVAVSVTLVFVVVGGLAGCGIFEEEEKEKDGGFNGRVGNARPGVKLTATPPAGDMTRYEIEFQWTAWDTDGEVDYFVYSIDPPGSAGADTVWEVTEAYSIRLTFTDEGCETPIVDERWVRKQSQIGARYHVFVIRAVDNLGARSTMDYMVFNAATICPQTRIYSPPPCCEVNDYQGAPQSVGLRVIFRWTGEDPDGALSDTPVGYLYKLTDVTGERSWRNIAARVFADPAPWVEIGPETTEVTLELADGHAYGFGVRAIDEEGGVEPLLLLNGNLLWVQARGVSSFPTLSVTSAAFGSRSWSGWSMDTETYEVPQGSTHELTMSGDAASYGGHVTGYSFGWDLVDIETPETHPDGIGAWTPWSTTRTAVLAQFSEPRDYFLHMKCKDDKGGMTLATIHFDVFSISTAGNRTY